MYGTIAKVLIAALMLAAPIWFEWLEPKVKGRRRYRWTGVMYREPGWYAQQDIKRIQRNVYGRKGARR